MCELHFSLNIWDVLITHSFLHLNYFGYIFAKFNDGLVVILPAKEGVRLWLTMIKAIELYLTGN